MNGKNGRLSYVVTLLLNLERNIHKLKYPHVLEKLTNGIGLEDLSKALGTTAAEVIEVNSKVEPHVFYICPHNLTARLGSHFMKVHIDRIKERSRKSSWWCIW